MSTENTINSGCAERAHTKFGATLGDVAAPGCAAGITIPLAELTQPGSGLQGRYVRGDVATWQTTEHHLERVAAGWMLTEVRG